MPQLLVGSEILALASNRASGGSIRKASTSYITNQGASIKTVTKAGDRAHASLMYGNYIRCLPTEVLFKILEQALTSIQGVNMATMTTNNPH